MSCAACHGSGWVLDDPVGEPGSMSVRIECGSCDGPLRDCSGCGEKTAIDLESEYCREVYCRSCAALICSKCNELNERPQDLAEDKYGCLLCPDAQAAEFERTKWDAARKYFAS